MADLLHPEPKTVFQARAYALLRAIAGATLARSTLTTLNAGRAKDTMAALRFLRDHSRVHICHWDDDDPVYMIGAGTDAPRPNSVFKPAPARPVEIPPPDPLLAALFASAARQLPARTAAPEAESHSV